ncbi:uncharacterized protein LOC108204542 [Daucus carota subsp. sativus]|uniref:uncharacterized protein LOC108204542 n=1 Tax=Daucus carota subsp. sativus TaxID=79200 RepID=UPI0007EEF565|nr:PREDICTED: protein O-glucosyltransferase 1-like [Daucus carota subsp. sativus]
MKEAMQNDCEKHVEGEDKDETCDATAHKFKFRWSEHQSCYSKLMVHKLKIGALTSASLVCVLMFVGAFLTTRWLDVSIFTGNSFFGYKSQKLGSRSVAYELQCSDGNTTQICPLNNPEIFDTDNLSAPQCPEYFRWIYEDLRPWKRTGLTREIVESGIDKANFRILVVDGKLYMDKYSDVFQTRDVFTVWGILQLLKLYPGKVPDLDFLFHCGDLPVIPRSDYMGANASVPPPVFHYCRDDSTLDLVFPDWSFWGWPEINIRPWVSLKNELKKGNKKIKWRKRKPYAHWQGNSWVSDNRGDLMKCNVTDKNDWNARLYQVNWEDEIKTGFKHTNLADQCTHRYKIYIEGRAWSVSEKYILACDSMTLLVKPQFYDFFTRSLQPLVHYWPINNNNKCQSIQFAVDWGNSYQNEAQRIGRAGSNFIKEGLKMENVYDYMYHTLNEYAKLMKYKPTVPPKAIELCSETMACSEHEEPNKRFKVESMVKNPSESSPCILAPPYSRNEIDAMKEKQESIRKQVEEWEGSEDVRKVNY